MLARIAPRDTRLGMYIQGFEGGWFSHPFWRSRFLLTSTDDLALIRESSVKAVIIDVSKGVGTAASEPHRAPQPETAPMPMREKPQRAIGWASVFPAPAPVERRGDSRKESADRAAATRTVARSKKIMRSVFDGARLGKAIRSDDVASVVDDISTSLDRNPQALIGVTRLKSKDEYTYLHSVAVCALMVNFARELGLDAATTHDLGMAGLLHDVGKMTVANTILNKPGKLTDEEFAEIRHHTDRGHAMLSESGDVCDAALDVCLHHHEKIDGTGYPFRLSAADISLHARMGAICDVYDAMTSNRSYKSAWTPVDTITAMRSWDGHFDAALLFRFMRSIGVYPVGTLVRLRSNQLAVALDNGRRASRPRFRAFYAITENAFVTPHEVVIRDSLAGDQVVEEANPLVWGFDDWDAMRAKLVADQRERRAA